MIKGSVKDIVNKNDWWILGRNFNQFNEIRIAISSTGNPLIYNVGSGFGPCSFNEAFNDTHLYQTLEVILKFMATQGKIVGDFNLYLSVRSDELITIDDYETWQKLANLTGKTIHLLRQSGGIGPLIRYLAVFRPT